jgi:hypothetical protein
MSKLNKASFGNIEGFGMPASDFHTSPALLTASEASVVELIGWIVPTNASVELGPVISMLPISKRRSSTMTEGFCTLANLTTCSQSWRKPAG